MKLNVAIFGCGAGGLATASDISKIKNFNVTICSGYAPKSASNFLSNGELTVVDYDNKTKYVTKLSFTTNIQEAIAEANIAIIVCPAQQRLFYLDKVSEHINPETKLILLPGGFATSAYIRNKTQIKSWAELNQLPYVARISDNKLELYFRLKKLWVGSYPKDNVQDYETLLKKMFNRDISAVDSVLEAELSYWNMILHPPIMLANAQRINREDKFKFYRDGITKEAVAFMEKLDGERVQIARALGYKAIPIKDYLSFDYTGSTSLETALLGDEATEDVYAPTSLNNRYLTEDVPYGLVPLSEFGKNLGVETPMADQLIQKANELLKSDFYATGFNKTKLGLEKNTIEALS